MDEIQSTPDAGSLQAECLWLRKQLQIILILSILVSATLTFFLLYQFRGLKNEVNGLRPMIDEYNKTMAPQMDDFVKRLQDYSRTHPDFGAIARKYGLDQTGQTAAPKK